MSTTNSFFWGFFLIVILYNLPALAADHPASLPQSAPAVAYLYGGKVYCLQIRDQLGAGLRRGIPKPPELWQGKLTLRGPLKKEKQSIVFGIPQEGVLYRWRISHGYFWSAADSVNETATVKRLPLEKVRITFDEWIATECLYDSYLAPVIALAGRHLLEPGLVPVYATGDAYFDALPGHKDEIFVLLAWRGRLRIWRGVTRYVAVEPALKIKSFPGKILDIKWDNPIYPKLEGKTEVEKEFAAEDARPILRLRTDMREPFIAYQDKTHFFFVTVSGKLYACRKRGENQRTEPLWNDARSPICAVIHDTASQKTFAFTNAIGCADKERSHVWFELAPKLETHAYNPKKIPDWKPADPLPTMMEYARILFWNVPPSGWRIPSRELSAQQRPQWWQDLSSTEMAKTHCAVWNLMAQADDTIAFLKERIHPVAVGNQNHLDQLLAEMDSNSFDRREAATRELSRGVVAEAALRKELKTRPSLEKRRRIEAILEDFSKWREKNPELLRQVRAIWVLQQIGTPEARSLLEKLASGAPSAALTHKAKDALQSLDRLKKR